MYIRHAGRSTITTDDVMLLARRNEGLEALLRSYMKRPNVESDRKKHQ